MLDDFYAKSGQIVSESKSRVFFSPNVDRDTLESLCDILGFQSTPNLGKYLGFPINHGGSNKQDVNFVLDKIKQSWWGGKPIYCPLQVRLSLSKPLLQRFQHMLCNAMLCRTKFWITLTGSTVIFFGALWKWIKKCIGLNGIKSQSSREREGSVYT